MEQHPQYKKLEENLFKFISDLHRYCPTSGTDSFIKQFKNLDIPKVINVFYDKMKTVEDKLNKKDESLFTADFLLFPEINISTTWSKLTSLRKEKIWTYLQILYIQSDILLNKNLEKKPLEFNPYVGIGDGDTNYGVEEMYSGVKNMPEPEKPGIGSVTNLLGINKMLNLDKLSNELKNMSKDDIDEATNNIKNLLGSNVDDKTTNLISTMLSSINEELKKDNNSTDNPLDNIFKIAESVADKIKPSIQKDGIDMNKLWSSTQNLATKCKDDKGNSVFGSGPNPFDMLTKMMNGNMNEDECIEQYQKMLSDIGGNNINLDNLQNMMGTNNKGKKNKKHKKK